MTLILSPAMVSQLEEMLMTKDVWTDPQAPHDSIATCIMPAAQVLYNANTDKLKPTGQAQTDKLVSARLALRRTE